MFLVLACAETIGKGHFGTVRLAEHALTKEKVAIKIIDKTKLDAVCAWGVSFGRSVYQARLVSKSGGCTSI